MNLRTFTLREMFLWIFFCQHRFTVMFDARKAVHLTGHQHELEQVAFNFGDQLGHALDHLTGEVLVILSEQNVVEVARHNAIVFAAACQETVDSPGQLAELFSPTSRRMNRPQSVLKACGFFCSGR